MTIREVKRRVFAESANLRELYKTGSVVIDGRRYRQIRVEPAPEILTNREAPIVLLCLLMGGLIGSLFVR